MIIYICTFLIILFCGIVMTMQPGSKRKYKKLYLVIVGILLTIILGLRASTVGEDTKEYLLIASAAKNLKWSEIFRGFPRSTWHVISYSGITSYNEKIESGYLIFNKVIMLVFDNPIAVQVMCAALICLFMFKFIYDNSENITMSVMGFIGEALYMNAFNLQRQILALAIGANAYTQIKQKQYIKGIVLILIASLFHLSALFYLALIPISLVKDYRRGINIIVLIVILSLLSINVIFAIFVRFFPVYRAYIENSYWNAGLGKTVIIWGLEILICIYIYWKNNMTKVDYTCICSISIYLGMEIIALSLVAFSRVALYYRVFVLLLFPCFIKYIKNKKYKKFYFITIIAIFAIQYWSAINAPSRLFKFCI